MAQIEDIGKAANNVASAAEQANKKLEELEAKAQAKIEEIQKRKAEAEAKVLAAKKKVDELKTKKEKMEATIALLQMPGGIGTIIIMFLKRTLKNTFTAEKAINLLKKQFESKCPLPAKLRELILKKNRITNVVTQVQKTIQTLQNSTQTISTFLIALNTIISGIKTIIAVAGSLFPAPSGPFITVDNIAETVGDDVKKNKNIVEQGLQGLIIINFSLITLSTLLAQIDALISLCLIEGLENGDITEEEFTEILTELNTTSTDSSNIEDDKLKGENLLSRLQPNSNDPFFYRGFRLEIQPNPKNPLETIPQRRVIGIQDETNILTVATDYSFASTTEVLVNEAKFLIDKWHISQTPVTSNIEIPIREINEEILEPQIEIPEPDTSAIDEANAAAENAQASAEQAMEQAATAQAEAERQSKIALLKSEITGWKSEISSIKSQLSSAIDRVKFNKKNKNKWKGRVDSWLPQQWLGQKAINAYKRIEKKYGDLDGALNNWFSLNKKIKLNEDKIAKL